MNSNRHIPLLKVVDWKVVPSLLENLPRFSCRLWLSHFFLSLHVIPDWLHNVETSALWGPYHLLQYSLLFYSLHTGFYFRIWLYAWNHCHAAEWSELKSYKTLLLVLLDEYESACTSWQWGSPKLSGNHHHASEFT